MSAAADIAARFAAVAPACDSRMLISFFSSFFGVADAAAALGAAGGDASGFASPLFVHDANKPDSSAAAPRRSAGFPSLAPIDHHPSLWLKVLTG